MYVYIYIYTFVFSNIVSLKLHNEIFASSREPPSEGDEQAADENIYIYIFIIIIIIMMYIYIYICTHTNMLFLFFFSFCAFCMFGGRTYA